MAAFLKIPCCCGSQAARIGQKRPEGVSERETDTEALLRDKALAYLRLLRVRGSARLLKRDAEERPGGSDRHLTFPSLAKKNRSKKDAEAQKFIRMFILKYCHFKELQRREVSCLISR